MAKPNYIELPTGERVPILYEDRSVLAIDKPRGWLLAPSDWRETSRNLQAALEGALRAGEYWARSRHLKYLRFVHRLDAETSGVLLLAKSPGALRPLSALFEGRQVEKTYLAVVHGAPKKREWSCRLKLAPDPAQPGRMKVDPRRGKEAETRFRVLQLRERMALLEVHPLTGRTHQIRVHLAASGHPVVGDGLYGQPGQRERQLGLRAVGLVYRDPFTRRRVSIRARAEQFVSKYGFEPEKDSTDGGFERQ